MSNKTVSLALVLMLSGVTAAQNILNNGGFESGLMCYQATTYSGNGPGDDYKIRLTSESHSGSYALEMACVGTRCTRAGALSNNIPALANQDYKLSVYAKCAPGSVGSVFLEGTSKGEEAYPINCTNNWEQHLFPFKSAPSGGEIYFFVFAHNGTRVLFDDITVTYADSSAPAQNILHPGTRNVSVNGKTVNVDGSPYFALGFWEAPYADLSQVAATGANTLMSVNASLGSCFNTHQLGYPDRAYELGLNLAPNATSTARTGGSAAMGPLVRQLAPHLANIAFMIADEPDQVAEPLDLIDPTIFAAQYSVIKANTSLPIFSDFQRSWDDRSRVAPYAPSTDFFMAEPYGPEFSGISHAADMFRSFPPNRPVWLAQDDPAANVIVPKAYWAVINGATGIVYFYWDAFKNNLAKMDAVRQVFNEVTQLKTVIFSQNIDPLITGPASIGLTARYSASKVYVMAVNPVNSIVPATFQIGGLTAGQPIEVMFENRTITASNGSFTDTFTGVSRHVYSINNAPAAIAGNLIFKSGPDNARRWLLQIFNSGIATVNAVQLNAVSLTQTGGKACAPIVVSPLPLAFAAIASGANTTADLTLDFNGCDTTSRFKVNMVISANAGNVINTIVRNNERK